MTASAFRRYSYLLVLGLLPLIAWSSYSLGYRYLLAKERSAMNGQLSLFSSDLESEIEKFSFLPRVLSRNQKLQTLLKQDVLSASMADSVNRDLSFINAVSNTEVIYLMRTDGTTIAASNWDASDSFIGGNFVFRPYFKNAIAGKEGRYFALGTTSRRRGYYFSAPVPGDLSSPPSGVVVVKVNIDKLEQSWQDYRLTFLVTDNNGVVFSSNDPGWRFRTLHPLSQAALADIRINQQYPIDILKQTRVRPDPRHPDLLSIEFGETTEKYLSAQQAISALSWNIYALKPASGLKNAALGYAALATLLGLLSWGLIHLSSLRRFNLREKLELELRAARELKEAHDKLEQRVEQRTQALRENNRILQQEISDRRHAENELRQTQNELIHAAKLAALGQLASGITHELNQPLAAISNYAENAQQFLSKQNHAQTHANLEEILRLSDRMSHITTQLKSFSHKTDGQPGNIDLNDCIHNALALLKARLKTSGTSITLELLDHAPVVANDIRLEQVFINLFSNAIDAMEQSHEHRITLRQSIQDGWVSTRVIDTGPGIDASQLPHIFDAFYTTKSVGVEFGLGLSISSEIVQNLGGRLHATNHPSGGAQFEILIRLSTRVTTQ